MFIYEYASLPNLVTIVKCNDFSKRRIFSWRGLWIEPEGPRVGAELLDRGQPALPTSRRFWGAL